MHNNKSQFVCLFFVLKLIFMVVNKDTRMCLTHGAWVGDDLKDAQCSGFNIFMFCVCCSSW